MTLNKTQARKGRALIRRLRATPIGLIDSNPTAAEKIGVSPETFYRWIGWRSKRALPSTRSQIALEKFLDELTPAQPIFQDPVVDAAIVGAATITSSPLVGDSPPSGGETPPSGGETPPVSRRRYETADRVVRLMGMMSEFRRQHVLYAVYRQLELHRQDIVAELGKQDNGKDK